MKTFGRSRGVALLLSLAILAVLAILATTFTRLMIMEHQAATNYVAAARARALANAGLDYALGKMKDKARNQHWSWFSEQRWVYKMRVYSGASFTEDLGAGLPLEYAVYPPGFKSGAGVLVYGGPSFYKGNTAVDDTTDPILATYPVAETSSYKVYSSLIDTKKHGRAISGWIGGSNTGVAKDGPRQKFVAGTYENWGDTFTTKVLDCSSQVNINMDTAYIREFLNLLGFEIDYFFTKRYTAGAAGEVTRAISELNQFGYRYPGVYFLTKIGGTSGNNSKFGDWLIAKRDLLPNKVFQSKEEILTLIREELGTTMYSVGGTTLRGDVIASEDYNKIKDFITLYGWRDRTVIEPGGLMTAELYEPHGTPWKEARTPINMNTVSNPVLTAWMRGIRYHRYDKGTYKSTDWLAKSKGAFGSTARASHLRGAAFKFRQITYYTPILAWKGFSSVIYGSTTVESQAGDIAANAGNRSAFISHISGWDKWDRDAFISMADPNTTLNKYNPDELIKREVDKYDIAQWTTEMSFNSMGYFEVYSLGTITHNGGSVVADKKIRGVYQVFDQVYKTTQRDFELDRLANGVDIATKKVVRLHDKGFWGVISMPEFRNRFRDYKEYTKSMDPKRQYDSLDPTLYGYVALYDGYLSFNVLQRQSFFTGDFCAGYNYPLFKNADATKNALDGLRPVGSTSKYVRTPVKFESCRSVVGTTATGPRLRMADPDSTAPLTYTRVAGGGLAALARFDRGSDSFPMGVYSDHLRGRALAYTGTVGVSGGSVGAVQFWVKPRWSTSVGKDSWWYWQDEDDQKLWIYRDGTTVVAWFSIGTDSSGLLKYDATHWKDGSWHHIHVDWGDTGRMFVDGEEADSGGLKGDGENPDHPEARHMDFGGWPPKTAEAMKTFNGYPDKYKTSIEWVEKHIGKDDNIYTNSGTHEMWIHYCNKSIDPGVSATGSSTTGSSTTGSSTTGIKVTGAIKITGVSPLPPIKVKPSSKKTASDYFGNATIDNVLVTTWRIYGVKQVTMPPGKIPFRYFPRTYQDYQKYYWQDITSEFASYTRDIHLGTIAWTNLHTNQSFIRVYVQIDTFDAQEAPGG